MSNYTSPDFVLDIMRKNNLRFFKVFQADGKTYLVHQADDTFTIDQAVEYLERTLESNTGTVHITLQPKAKMGTGGDSRVLKYMVDTRDISTPADAVSGIGTVDIDAKIAAVEQKWQHKFEIDKLERELAEAKQGNPMVDKVLAGIMPLLAPQPQAVAGTSGENDPPVDEDRVRVSRAVGRLMTVDTNFVEHLEALADLAENNPTMYNMAIGQLKNMQG